MAAQLGRDAATAAGFRGKPACEAKILKVEPYKNTNGSMLGFLDVQLHLLLVDDGGGLILVEQVDDLEVALWLADVVNDALDAARRRTP